MIAAIDDRLKFNCEIIQKSTTINFGREFWMTPTIQIFLAGFQKEIIKGDLKFQLQITRQQVNSFDTYIFVLQLDHKMLLNQNPQQISTKRLMNLQVWKELQKIQFMEQFEYEQEKPGVGISQVDMIMGLIQNDGMLCPLGYYECNFNGILIALCESTSGSQSWKRIKSIKSRKGWNGKFKIDGIENLRLMERLQRLKMLIAFKIFNYIQRHEDSLIRCIENNILFKQLKLIHDYSYQMFYLWKGIEMLIETIRQLVIYGMIMFNYYKMVQQQESLQIDWVWRDIVAEE